jgi:FkbM family methyltransferase
MGTLKRLFKRNTHNALFKNLAGFGRSLNRMYENKNYDIHSNGEVMIIKKLTQVKAPIVIDGGANVGEYSIAVHDIKPEATVYAFEPVSGTFLKLQENVAHCSNVTPVQKGLYKENKEQEIHLFPSTTHSSLYDIKGWKHTSEETETIALTTGDSFLEAHDITNIDLLKIDIEGAEYDAIKGFEKSLRAGKIRAIQFEYGYINITTKKLLIDYYEYFESVGYIIGKIFPKVVEFRKYSHKHEDFLGPNFIAVRKTDTELITLLEKK